MGGLEKPGWGVLMLGLSFNQSSAKPLQVLCLGAHCDDIEIGCGGTILKLIDAYPDACFTWVVFSSSLVRREEALGCASDFLSQVNEKRIAVEDFRNSFFPYIGGEIKEYFEGLKQVVDPDVVFTHYRDDLHQDHRVISDLTWNTFRNHLILEYEIPKYDGDLGSPNFFVPLDEKIANLKVEVLLSFYRSQADKHWFTPDTFTSLMRLRAVESGSQSRYAEAFYTRKVVMC